MRKILGVTIVLLVCVAVLGEQAITPIKDVNAAMINKTVLLKGRVVKIVAPTSERAPYSFYVSDGTETIRLVIWRTVYSGIENSERFKEGVEILARGAVKMFRNNLEVHLLGPSDVWLSSEEEPTSSSSAVGETAAPVTGISAIGFITAEMVGKNVTIEGEVTNFRASWKETAPNIATVTDASGSIDVVYWSDVNDQLSEVQKPQMGKNLRVSGQVDVYTGALQLRVRSPQGIQAVGEAGQPQQSSMPAPAATGEAAAPAAPGQTVTQQVLPLAFQSSQLVGKAVMVTGSVIDIQDRGSWYLITIEFPSAEELEQLIKQQVTAKGEVVHFQSKDNRLFLYVDKQANMVINNK